MPIDASVSRRWIQVAIVGGVIVIAIALLLPAVQHARESARRNESRNNLRQIGLALHNYHDAYNRFPSGGVFDENGTAYHGWPMQIVPFIDSNNLFNQIDFNIPWDKQEKRDVFRWRLPVFTIPGCDPVVNDDGYGLCHYNGNKLVLFPNSSMSLTDMKDGTEQTILAGEIFADFIPYAQPGNWRDPAAGIHRSPQSFGHPNADAAFILMADGAVHWIPKEIDRWVFRALGTPAGRENIPPAVYSDVKQ